MKCEHCGTELGHEMIEGERCETIHDDMFHTVANCRDALKAQLREERRMPVGFKPCESCGRCDQNIRDLLIELEDVRTTIDTPEIGDFLAAVERESKHQRLRWAAEHDEGKTDADWFWLLGWLAGKAVHATTSEKRLHHIITTAAACLNWHAHVIGASNVMRPGIEAPHE